MRHIAFLLALLGAPDFGLAVVLRASSPIQSNAYQLENNSAFFNNNTTVIPTYAGDSKADSEVDFTVTNLKLQHERLKLNQDLATDNTKKSPFHVATEMQRTHEEKKKVHRKRTARSTSGGCWGLVTALNENKAMLEKKIEKLEKAKSKEEVETSQEQLVFDLKGVAKLSAAYTNPQPPKKSEEVSEASKVTLQNCSEENDAVQKNLRSSITALTASKAKTEEDLKTTKEALNKAKLKIDQLETEIAASRKGSKANAEEELKLTKEDLNKARRKTDQLELEVAALRKGIPVMSDWMLLAEHKGKISDLKAECSNDIHALEDKITSMGATREDSARALKTMEDQLDVCTRQLSEIDGRESLNMIEMKEKFDDLEKRYDELSTNMGEVTRERDDIQAKFSDLEKEKAELEKKFTDSTAEKGDMAGEMKKMAEESARKTSMMVTMNKNWINLKMNYTKCESFRENLLPRHSTESDNMNENY